MWRVSLVSAVTDGYGCREMIYDLVSVNVFYRINQERPDPDTVENEELAKQECEFKIGSIGLADSMGILVASVLSIPTEMELCKVQVERGKLLCQGL